MKSNVALATGIKKSSGQDVKSNLDKDPLGCMDDVDHF